MARKNAGLKGPVHPGSVPKACYHTIPQELIR